MRQTGYGSQDMQQTREKYAADKWWTDQYTAVRQQSREFACDSRRNLHGINLVVSYINQDTSFLRGDIRDFAGKEI